MRRVLAQAKLGSGDVAGAIEVALKDSVNRPDEWKEVYGCVAVAVAGSGNLRAARTFAEPAPNRDASYDEAFLALARFAMEKDPANAAPLIEAVAVLAGGNLDHGQKDEVDFLARTLTCLYGDRRDLVPIALGAKCRTR
jgi:hypothetical protein